MPVEIVRDDFKYFTFMLLHLVKIKNVKLRK
jgi:hypothetical protein